jgi:signal transduction histidine kinase
VTIAFLAVIIHLAARSVVGPVGSNLGGLRSLVYYPLLLYLFKAPLFQKVFAFSLQMVCVISSAILINGIVESIFGTEGMAYTIAQLIGLALVFIVNVVPLIKYSDLIREKLLFHGSQKEWALYSAVELLSFGMMALAVSAVPDRRASIAFVFFILLSSAVLCFAIINTHEKTKKKIEADFAVSLISNARGHYQKMNEIQDTLRILRHDYKYHLNVVKGMLGSGHTEEAGRYLADIEEQFADTELPVYCLNSAVNTLLTTYAERCEKLGIQYDVEIHLPDELPLPNYELCVVLGNLLENAVEACEKCTDGRRMELVMKQLGRQLVIKAANSLNRERNPAGNTEMGNVLPASTKTDGGFGLRSVKTVAEKYRGELIFDRDEDMFTVYVSLMMETNVASLHMA